jgi:PKD repeat protein
MRNNRVIIVLAVLLVSLGVVTSALAAAGMMSNRFNQPDEGTPSSTTGEKGLLSLIPNDQLVIRLYFTDQANLNEVAGQLDIWEVHLEKLYVVAAVTPDQYQWLQSLGYRLEIDAGKTANYGINALLDTRFYYFDNFFTNANGLYMVDFLRAISNNYPTLTQLIDIGDAYLASQPAQHDRDIWVLRITNEDPAYGDIANKPAFFLFSNVHAREVAIPELAIRYIKYLTQGYKGEGGYGHDPDVTWLVNHNVVYVLVSQNPDGHWVNEQNTSAYRRKNMDPYGGCSSSTLGVDLNRNSSFLWGCCGGSSGSACDDTYRGPSKGSEPETQAFQNYFATVMRDQNGPNGDNTIAPASPITTTGVFLSLHSYSDDILWPWGFMSTIYPDPPNFAQLQTIGRKMAYYNGYSPVGSIGYPVDGTTDNWTYGKFGIPSFTIEVGPSGGTCSDFFPPYGCIDGIDGMPRNFWTENKPVFLYLHKIARTPYLTTYGPDTGGVSVVPGVTTPGTEVLLSATIADHRYSNDPLKPINAAEYFIDAPGADGVGIPMNPADGNWGGTSEAVTATVNTTALSIGKHYLLVHGRNTDGTWGPFTAVFLYVLEPGVAPVLEGYVRDAHNNAPLAATVSAGTFQAMTDPATGYYHMPVISGTYTMTAAANNYSPVTVGGIHAQDYQVIQQNFYLQAPCTVFFDNIESGNLGWTVQSPWAITTEASHSPTHSWTDSPGTPYGNYVNISLTSLAFNLSGYTGMGLSFWHIYDTEPGWDYGRVEYSINGTTWTQVAAYSGYGHTTWTQTVIPLPALDGQANARIRFRFTSDSNTIADGWHVDDIRLTGSGPSCSTPISPTAEFTSTSPVYLGTPMRFIDMTHGTPPFQYHWDFGDGIGSSTAGDPIYTYTAPGIYTATMVVTNSLGSSSISHPVVVQSTVCMPIVMINLTQVSQGTIFTDTNVIYNADILPNTATKPYTYTINYGDGLTPTTATSSHDPLVLNHSFESPGTYPIEIAAWNCSPTQTVTSSLETTVVSHTYGLVVLPTQATRWGDPGMPVTYTLRVTNTGNTADTVSVSTGSHSWTTELSAGSIGPLAAGASHEITVTVTIPLDAPGGASDSVNIYFTSSHASLQPVSSTLTTQAKNTYGLELAPYADAQSGYVGTSVTYTILVTNTGNTTDIYDMAITSTWGAQITTPIGPLTSGSRIFFTVVINIPRDAIDGSRNTATVAVTSWGDPMLTKKVILTTTARAYRLFLPVMIK